MNELFMIIISVWFLGGVACYVLQLLEDLFVDKREWSADDFKVYVLELALCCGLGLYGLVDYVSYVWARYVAHKKTNK